MSLADTIYSDLLNDFKDQSPRTPLPAPFDKPGAVHWKDIKDLPQEYWDGITALLKADDAQRRANQSHNEALLEKFRCQLIDMMRAFGVQAMKPNGSLYAPYQKMIDEIKCKYRLNTHGGYNFSKYCIYDDDRTFNDDSYDAYRWFQSISSKVDSLERRYAKKRTTLIEYIKYAVENGMEVSQYKTDEELINAVINMQEEALVLETYPTGSETEIYHGKSCSITHGEQFCKCGEQRITYSVTGDIKWGAYATAQWQSAFQSVDVQTLKVHPSINQDSIIPF